MIVAAPSETIYARNDVFCATLDDNYLLWSSTERRLHVLNRTAGAVWEAASRHRSRADVVAHVANVYGLDSGGAPAGEIARDIDSLLDRFLDAGLCSLAAPISPTAVDAPVAQPAMHPVPARDFLHPFSVWGVTIMLSCNDEALSDELARILHSLQDRSIDLDAPGKQGPIVRLHVARDANTWSVYRDGTLITQVSQPSNALRAVLRECNGAPLERQSSNVVFHAAGADLGSGQVLFPGVSNAGKSTLITQLVQRGHGYLSDEAIAVSLSSLHAQPFHKAICLEKGAQAMFGELEPQSALTQTWDVDPRGVGPGRLSSGGPICAIVFPEFRADAALECTPLSPFETLQGLLANAFEFRTIGQACFTAMVALAGSTPAHRLVHPGGEAAVDHVEALLGGADCS